MKLEVKVESGALTELEGEVCVLGIPEGGEGNGALSSLGQQFGKKIQKICSSEGVSGKFKQTILIRTEGTISFKRLLLVGLGKRDSLTSDRLRQAMAQAAVQVREMALASLSIYCDDRYLTLAPPHEMAQTIVEGVQLALYQFDQYKTEKSSKKKIKTCFLITDHAQQVAEIEKGALRGQVIAAGVHYVRDLCNMPSNKVTPTYLAEEAAKIAEMDCISLEVLEGRDIKELGMGAFYAVTQGTAEPPKFIILEYKGNQAKKKRKPIAIIGKSVTFDSGGISLKPSEKMEQMKYDMSGGATVLGMVKVVAQLKLPLDIVAFLPATDNMPSGTAVHPGDVVTTLSGKTVEIINTDAEGRLCLADALTYATRYKPEVMIDLATLTGAVIVALGHQAMGLMGNNRKLISQIQAAGEKTGERTWELPLWEEYQTLIEGDVADLKNVGGRGAGTITAGLFLKAFVADIPWVHLDIAGTSWGDVGGKHPYIPKSATGVALRLLIQYLTERANGENDETA